MNTLDQEIEQFRRSEDGRIIQGAAHTSQILNHKVRNKYVIKTFTALRKLNFDYDSIACSGVSGSLIVPQVAELLNKNIILVRKTLEKTYSEFLIEGVAPTRYIIVDDLICSGNTVKHILRSIKEEHPRAICMGVYTYMKDECAYRINPKLCRGDLGIDYLNP